VEAVKHLKEQLERLEAREGVSSAPSTPTTAVRHATTSHSATSTAVRHTTAPCPHFLCFFCFSIRLSVTLFFLPRSANISTKGCILCSDILQVLTLRSCLKMLWTGSCYQPLTSANCLSLSAHFVHIITVAKTLLYHKKLCIIEKNTIL
jgi:hypothetical protein